MVEGGGGGGVLHCRSNGGRSGGRRRKRGSFMVAFVDSKERETPAELGFSSSPILWPATTPFIGTPGIIRSEFVFSRPCAVLAVGVSSIRPATDYWTKTRG